MELPDRDAHELHFATRLGKQWSDRRKMLNRVLAELPTVDGQPDVDLFPDNFWDQHKRDDSAEIALLLYLMMSKSAALHLDGINAGDKVHSFLASEDRTRSILGSVEPILAD